MLEDYSAGYREACWRALEYFEAEHRKDRAIEIERMLSLAATDSWALARVHALSLRWPDIREALSRRPDLLAEIQAPVSISCES